MKRNRIKILVIAVIIIAALVQSNYNAECMRRNWDYAIITTQGVYCKSSNFLRPYKALKDIPIEYPFTPWNQNRGTT
jgi:hypothetical protein